MTTEHDPYEAGLGFAVRMDKGDFVGRAALEGRSEATAARRLVRSCIADPAAVVMGKEPVDVDGRPAGYVTSAGVRLLDRRADRLRLAAGRGAPQPGQAVTIRYFGEAVPATVGDGSAVRSRRWTRGCESLTSPTRRRNGYRGATRAVNKLITWS